MTTNLVGLDTYIPQTWTLNPSLKSKSLPAVRDVQKKRVDDLNPVPIPVIGKSKRYYGQLKFITILTKLEEYSKDIEIAGKTAYHIGGKELADDTSIQLNCGPLHYTKETIKDLDIRVIVTDLKQYNSFIDFLQKLFPRASKSDILNDLILASHCDKETMSFSLGDENSVTIDILFSFKPTRKHLFWRDAFRYSYKDNAFISDLENPLQGVSDYYQNVVQTDNPKTINKKGWSKFLVHKAKEAQIPDASLEGQLFDNVVNSEKRKELAPEIVYLLTNAGKKASISFEDLLYEGSLVLEKKLNPNDFKAVWAKGKGKVAEAIAAGIPFHVIHSYLQLIGQKKGSPDLTCLFKTPFKKELDKLFDQAPLDERLAPLLFQHPNPRVAWKEIKSKSIADNIFQLLLDNDPLLAKEAVAEFSLPYKNLVFQALIKKGHINEADSLYDELNDNTLLEDLTLKLLAQDPSITVFESYLSRSNGNPCQQVITKFIESLPIPDLIEIFAVLLPLNRDKLIERIGPYLESLGVDKIVSCAEEIKNEGIKRLVKKQIENPVQKEWRKLIDHAIDDDIEPLFRAILQRVSINEARLFCLHPRVVEHSRHVHMVEAVAQEANIAQKSLYWDILDLCLSYHPKEAVRLIEYSRGNTSGLPRQVLKRMTEARDNLLETAENAFTLAECFNDLKVEATSLVTKTVSLQFNSIPLLKEGWLGKDSFDIETTCYFVEHPKFEMFYPHIASRLHPTVSLQPCIDNLIKEKKYAFAASLTSKVTSSSVLAKLRGLQIKERTDLLKKFGDETEWEIYLNEPEKKSEEIYRYLLNQPVSEKIKVICLTQSASAWEYYLTHTFELNLKDPLQAYEIIFKRGLEGNQSYPALQKLRECLGPMEPSLQTKWETHQFLEEPYHLERTLRQTPSPQTIISLISKIYSARPPKKDYESLEPWMKSVSIEQKLEIQVYFDPAKTAQDILLIRPDMILIERLFLRLLEIGELKYLKHVYTQFNNDYRDKHRRTFLINAIHERDSHEYAVIEFQNMPAHEREFEAEFVTALFDEASSLTTVEWYPFYSIWLKVIATITSNSKTRTSLIPSSKFEWENEEDLIKGHISLENQTRVKKLAQHDLKAKKAEAAHTCKLVLKTVTNALKRKFDSELAQQEIFNQLMKLIPYHNLMTGELDDAVFDFACLIPPSYESIKHRERCYELLKCMDENKYSAHYPSSMITIKTLLEGCESSAIELNKIAENLVQITRKIDLKQPIEPKLFASSESEFDLHLAAIFKAYKKLIEYDTFYTYVRAWLIISNIQISLLRLRKFDWLFKIYQLACINLPKYAFCETQDNYYMIILIKGLITDLLRLGKEIKDTPLTYKLLPEYIESLFKALEFCPPILKQSFIADIMSLTLQYSDGKIKLIFNKLIDYIEKIVELTFQHADIMQIEMFSQGITETLTQYVKEPNIREMEKDRLKVCMNKFKKALKAQSHFYSLQNLVLQWSLNEKTLNIIAHQV